MTDGQTADQTILVVGGGISGLTAAVEAAEVGHNVLLVEQTPHLGGRVSQHNKYFPKLCSPTCGLEINYQRIKKNPRIRVMTLAEVGEISGSIGDYSVKIRQIPRFVNEKCTACGDCATACTTEVNNDYNFGMSKSKAIRINHDMAYPNTYYMDADFAKTDEAKRLVDICPVKAIELDMAETTVEEKVTSVVWATGWTPYDAEKIQPYGYGRFANVTTNMRFERMANTHGPSEGKILRPSDSKEAKKIAFIQCAGSRDHNHLPFCSRICCLASMKQATYVREQYPDSEVTIFYIDLRAMDKYEAFQKKVEADKAVTWIKSKPARIDEDGDGNPVVIGEDTLTGVRYSLPFDMVVLATGMEPNSASSKVPSGDATYDDYGFVLKNGGIIPAGCSGSPSDVSGSVQSATASALKAIQAGVKKG
jgi:quinone-modifying oxidoreductase, subunit QmoA